MLRPYRNKLCMLHYHSFWLYPKFLLVPVSTTDCDNLFWNSCIHVQCTRSILLQSKEYIMISIPTAVHVKHLSQYTVKLLQNCQINLMSPVTILQIILESASWRVLELSTFWVVSLVLQKKWHPSFNLINWHSHCFMFLLFVYFFICLCICLLWIF